MARSWSKFPHIHLYSPKWLNRRVSEQDFHAVHAKLQEVLSELSKAKDSSTRRRLLIAMRELLAEADQLMTDLPPEEQVIK